MAAAVYQPSPLNNSKLPDQSVDAISSSSKSVRKPRPLSFSGIARQRSLRWLTQQAPEDAVPTTETVKSPTRAQSLRNPYPPPARSEGDVPPVPVIPARHKSGNRRRGKSLPSSGRPDLGEVQPPLPSPRRVRTDYADPTTAPKGTRIFDGNAVAESLGLETVSGGWARDTSTQNRLEAAVAKEEWNDNDDENIREREQAEKKEKIYGKRKSSSSSGLRRLLSFFGIKDKS